MSSVDSGLALVLKNAGDLAVKADTNKPPVSIGTPGLAGHMSRFWNFREQRVEEFVAPAKPRDYTAATVASLADLINEFTANQALRPPSRHHRVGLAEEVTASEAACSAIKTATIVFVWINKGTVRVTLDETGDRREVATLSLTRSGPFKSLLGLHEAGKVTQKGMIMALRVDINGVYSPSHVIDTIRSLKITANTSGESTVETGRSNFGRRVEASVAGVSDRDLKDIEDLCVTVPVYADLFDENKAVIQSTFACAVDVDPEDQSFILKIKAGAVDRNLRELDEKIHDMLKNTITGGEVRIFYGVPSNP